MCIGGMYQVDIAGAIFLVIPNLLKDDIDGQCSKKDFFWLLPEFWTTYIFESKSDISCSWNSYAQAVKYNNYLKCQNISTPSKSPTPRKRKADHLDISKSMKRRNEILDKKLN